MRVWGIISTRLRYMVWYKHLVYVGYTFQVESLLPAASAVGDRGVHGLEMYAL